MPWCVVMSAVVHTGSMILRSEWSATFSVVSAEAAGAKVRLAAKAARPRTPSLGHTFVTRIGTSARTNSGAGRIEAEGPSVVKRRAPRGSYPLSQQVLQLPEVAGAEVGNGPIVDAAAAPGEQVVAVARDEPGRRIAGTGAGPHEHVDGVQAALVHDGADAAAADEVEPPTEQREAVGREVFHFRGEIDAAGEPRLDGVRVGGGHLDGAVLQQRADVSRQHLLLQTRRLAGRADDPPRRQRREHARRGDHRRLPHEPMYRERRATSSRLHE